MMRKMQLWLLPVLLVTTLLSGCMTLPTRATERANRAAAGAVDAANKARTGAAAIATKAAASAASAMDNAAPLAAGANKVACESLQGMNRAFGQAGSFSPDTSVADVLAFKQRVDPFVNPMRVLAVTMGLDPVTQFILAYDAFGLLIRSLPADANLGAASGALTASMTALMGATVQAERALDCGSP